MVCFSEIYQKFRAGMRWGAMAVALTVGGWLARPRPPPRAAIVRLRAQDRALRKLPTRFRSLSGRFPGCLELDFRRILPELSDRIVAEAHRFARSARSRYAPSSLVKLDHGIVSKCNTFSRHRRDHRPVMVLAAKSPKTLRNDNPGSFAELHRILPNARSPTHCNEATRAIHPISARKTGRSNVSFFLTRFMLP